MVRLLSGLAFAFALSSTAQACPFCSGAQMTFTEELDSADVAVIAEEVRGEKPATKQESSSKLAVLAPEPKTKFRILQVIKGEKHLGKVRELEVLYFGRQPEGTKFYITGSDPTMINWSTPVAVSDRSQAYILKLPAVPKAGWERLEFFQGYLEHAEEMLARDAYDEFAKAPYDAVKGLKPKMNHDQIMGWIANTKIPASRRRLYLTMLGVCGVKEDVPVLEKMITGGDREAKFVLDALVAAYLVLRGPEGMVLVEDQFLKNKKAEYTDIWSTIQALRVMGQISDAVPKARLVVGFRHMLDRPDLADLVIPDLARWEDWESMDRMVQLFKDADEKGGSFVRVPVLRFLMACPKPEAKERIKELAMLDPDAMKRASTFLPSLKKADPPVPPPTPKSASKGPADKASALKIPEKVGP